MRKINNIWLRSTLSILLSVVAFSALHAQTARLYGTIKNNWTYEPGIGVNVYVESLQKGAASDFEGNYELVLPYGQFRVTFSSVEHETLSKVIDITGDTKLDVFLKDKSLNLEAITVYSGAQDVRVKDLNSGKTTLNIEKLKTLPSFMGETDVVKSLILLPGVSTVGEGSSGFNVRGGGVDQNLILQDGAIIFNPSHVFGFFSVFNPQVVDNATLYKGSVPVQYGGRLSSVLEVNTKDGDFKKHNIQAGIGLVASKATLDGPIIKDKLSYVVGLRGNYSDWLLRTGNSKEYQNSSATFRDGNLKLTYLINDKNKLTYSGYLSDDGFAFSSDTAFSWTTINNSLRWKYLLSEQAEITTDLITGVYKYSISDPNGVNSFEINSSIKYHKATSHLNIAYDNGLSIDAGLNATYYDFQPGKQIPHSSESGIENLELEHEQSIESAVYAGAAYKINSKINVGGGIRVSHFQNLGSGTDYLYEAEGPRTNDRITDTVYYANGAPIATYIGLEPRANVNISLSASSSLKLSYNRQYQYLHLISNTAAVTPTDFWKTSNHYIKPQAGDQYSIGFFKNLKNNSIETSVEAYYKTAENVSDFKNGSTLLMNENLEADLLQGEGKAYGLELFLNKKTGKWTGWVGYTFSRSWRRTDGKYEEEKISNGNWYSANYDKPHDFTTAVNYQSSPIAKIGINFTYSTGRPVTVPTAAYSNTNLSNVFNYSTRNAERIPDYHRLDLSLTIDSKPRIDRKWKLSWVFALYNVYGRKNAYSVFFENQYGSPPQAYKLSVLGAAFPSISVNFKR